MLDIAFIALLVSLAALVVGFAVGCDWLSGPEEPAPSEISRGETTDRV